MPTNRMNKKERSWVLYDVGNSAFVMLTTAVVPPYFASLTTGSVLVEWGFAQTIAFLIVALLMPILGSLADFKGNRKKFLVGAVGTGVIACMALGLPTTALPFLIIYIIAAVGLNTSFVFYDAFIVDATTTDKFDLISAKGYAWGYVGSLIPFGLCLALILGGGLIGIDTATGVKISFVIVGLWWAAFTIPILRNLPQTHFKPAVSQATRKAFVGLWTTLKKIAKNKKLLLFMIAFFFYIDGVHTIIAMATAFGSELGIDNTQMIIALVVTQLVAFPSALGFGKFAGKIGADKMLVIAVVAYIFITLFAAFFLYTALEFWILAVCVGLFQGGIQALSRSYFGKLIPKSNANEYYGFFDILGKYAAVLGPALIALFSAITGNPHSGILSITVLFIIGLVFLLLMQKTKASDNESESVKAH